MLTDFFKQNEPVTTLKSADLVSLLKNSKSVHSVYLDDDFVRQRVELTKFENVSFSKQLIKKVTFNSCVFSDCLFIGTELDQVSFHNCAFINCNFFRVRFYDIYARPEQFKKAITKKEYANIAVHLYQELRKNYRQESQSDYRKEAEYGFRHWRRFSELNEAIRKEKPPISYIFIYVWRTVYDWLFGFGYRLRNTIVTTSVSLVIMVAVNYRFAPIYIFNDPNAFSILRSVYFTITTMVTLGSGDTPKNDPAYALVLLNVAVGISLLSTTLTAILKRIAQ